MKFSQWKFERETELVDVSNNSFDFSKFRLRTSVNYVVLHMHYCHSSRKKITFNGLMPMTMIMVYSLIV